MDEHEKKVLEFVEEALESDGYFVMVCKKENGEMPTSYHTKDFGHSEAVAQMVYAVVQLVVKDVMASEDKDVH